ncbi:MAG: TauD/TfdA family dioxygenase [Actinomycetota bacterium]
MTDVSPVITGLDSDDAGVRVSLADRPDPLVLPWFWIRDHSDDPSALDVATHQRAVDTFTIDRSRTGTATVTDGVLRVTWPDDTPTSVITPSTLAAAVPTEAVAAGPAEDRPLELWRDPDDVHLTDLDHEQVMAGGDGLRAWMHDIATFGVGVVRGVPTGDEAAEALANRIGYVRRSVFGDVWRLSAEAMAFADSSYGAETLLPHTDGCYSHDGPGLQFFVCAERTGTGGESTAVDAFAAAEALRAADPEAFDLLAEVAVPHRYLDDGIHLEARRPTLRLDDRGELVQVTLNNYDRAPFLLDEGRLQPWYDAYAAYHELVNDRACWWSTRLEPGDALVVDNWRCLHGRLAFTGTRVFYGGYLNHEDFESRLRVLDR